MNNVEKAIAKISRFTHVGLLQMSCPVQRDHILFQIYSFISNIKYYFKT